MKKLIDFLGSSRVAIVLFFLLAVISVLGTLIPQYKEPGFYLNKYGGFLGKLILSLQLNDAYHSWWYVLVLFLFLLNLTICSIKRFPITLKLFKRDPRGMEIEKLPNRKILNFDEGKEALLKKLLTKWGFKEISEGFYYKERYRWGYFSVYVVHFSLIIILIGGLLGALFGLVGNLPILEGESNKVVQPFRKGEPHFLPFQIKLNKFVLEFYPDGRPKEFISNVTVMDNLKNQQFLVKVNSPLIYKGYKFYQAGYQVLPEFKIKVSDGLKTEELILSPGVPVVFNERFQIGVMRFSEAHDNLFVWIWIIDEEKRRQAKGLLIKGVPHFKLPLEEGRFLHIDLIDIEKIRFLSILQVKKDPFTAVVYLGFILLCAGIFLVYYGEPQILWVGLRKKEDHTELFLGSFAKRTRSLTENLERKILSELSLPK